MRRMGLVLFIAIISCSSAAAENVLPTLLYLGGSILAEKVRGDTGGKWLVRAINAQTEGEAKIIRAENEVETQAVKHLAPAQATTTVLGAKDKRDLTHAVIELRKSGKISEEVFADGLEALSSMSAGSVQEGGISLARASFGRSGTVGYYGPRRSRSYGRGYGRVGGYRGRGRPYYNPHDAEGSLAAGAAYDRAAHEEFIERARAANRAARGW